MPYPPRTEHRPLAAFVGTASPRPDPAVQAQVERFVMEQYAAGRSLRELAELTDRSFSAVRKILDRHGVRRRGPAHHRDTDPAGPVDGPRLAGVDGPSASGLPDPTVHEV